MNTTAHVPQSFGGKHNAVTLARAPWDPDTQGPDPRPETALPRGIVSPRHRLTVEQRVEIIRREWIRVRAEA